MKCNIHNEKYIWISEIDNSYYCNKCIDKMIEEDMYLTSNNWDYLESESKNKNKIEIIKEIWRVKNWNCWWWWFKNLWRFFYIWKCK